MLSNTSNNIVIIGAGFSGLWSALSTKRLLNLHNKQGQIDVVVIAPEPELVMRPRLYERGPAGMKHGIAKLLEDAGIKFIRGTVARIHPPGHNVEVELTGGGATVVNYARLILAAGSSVVRPTAVSGLEQHAFDIDNIHSASDLEAHLNTLRILPASAASQTVVVCGAGFTGIEVATEMPQRLPKARIVLVEAASAVGPELGPGPRPVIMQALRDLDIEVKLGSRVTTIDDKGVTLSSGERIEAATVVWTAGVKATPLTQQVDGPKDALGRLHVDDSLRVPSEPHIYAAGDAACAIADANGQAALMSCQHAIPMGRISGHNAAAGLINVPLFKYSHVTYGCCLDLGASGAIISEGYDRLKTRRVGSDAKRVKRFINEKLIYPPDKADEAFEMAGPAAPDSKQLFDMIEAM